MKKKDDLKEIGLTPRQIKAVIEGRKPKPKLIKHHITDNTFTFAIVSDTHLCSTEERLNELHTFYDICRKEKISVILHIGDLVAGQNVYRGQENELKVFGADNQAKYVIDYYPKVDGITTYFITGNHDLSHYDKTGNDLGYTIASARPDMVYMGKYNAEIMFGNIRVRMVHPKKAGAYALSYNAQKFAEQIQSGKKPHILLFGHAHTSLYFWYRNMHIFHCGTFQAQTTLELRLGLNPAIGGWTVKCHIKDGKDPVVGVTPCWIPFF